jgi:eukaryotic-like serine/threonine-protein kinase
MPFKARQTLGKYRIVRRLASGGFAEVYKAIDTVEGISVALKIPHAHLVTPKSLEDFKREVRLMASLDHPNILPLKNAGHVEGHFLLVQPLGLESLEDRLARRVAARRVIDFGRQMLEALAFAHSRRIIHRDLKPDNLILFAGERLRLTDFGIARIAWRTLEASGSGTLGYLAPEQAFGRPSPRSDVFAAGLILARMMTGVLPTWPFAWPYEGLERARRKFHPDLIALVRRATEVDHKKRYVDAAQMLAAYQRLQPRALQPLAARRRSIQRAPAADWRTIRWKQFRREFGSALDARHECASCAGPVSEPMAFCPWCRQPRKRHEGTVRTTHRCPRCRRGQRADWRFCPYCYGAATGPLSPRSHEDPRYERRCRNPKCTRKEQLPFMRYCPWCRHKTTHPWLVEGSRDRCARCRWGVALGFWEHCPWCSVGLPRSSTRRS